MKSTAILLAFCLLILETQGAKKVAPDHFFKMSAAQVSKLKFLFQPFVEFLKRWREKRMHKNVCDETKRNLTRVVIINTRLFQVEHVVSMNLFYFTTQK